MISKTPVRVFTNIILPPYLQPDFLFFSSFKRTLISSTLRQNKQRQILPSLYSCDFSSSSFRLPYPLLLFAPHRLPRSGSPPPFPHSHSSGTCSLYGVGASNPLSYHTSTPLFSVREWTLVTLKHLLSPVFHPPCRWSHTHSPRLRFTSGYS